MVQEAWDQVSLDLAPASPIADLKRQALSLTHTAGEPAEFEVKFRGASILDEARSLADSGVKPNSQLIVLRRRRRAVR
jgi:hypothetical protein